MRNSLAHQEMISWSEQIEKDSAALKRAGLRSTRPLPMPTRRQAMPNAQGWLILASVVAIACPVAWLFCNVIR